MAERPQSGKSSGRLGPAGRPCLAYSTGALTASSGRPANPSIVPSPAGPAARGERTGPGRWPPGIDGYAELVHPAPGAGLTLAARHRLDVALMDIRLPRLDGIEVTRRLLAEPREPPTRVLVLTTFDLDEYVYEALRAGASGFLLKDVPPEAARARGLCGRGRRGTAGALDHPSPDRAVRAAAGPRPPILAFPPRAHRARARRAQAARPRDIERRDRRATSRRRGDRQDRRRVRARKARPARRHPCRRLRLRVRAVGPGSG
jgi:DNA-binding NarL/FixJ family response regulator